MIKALTRRGALAGLGSLMLASLLPTGAAPAQGAPKEVALTAKQEAIVERVERYLNGITTLRTKLPSTPIVVVSGREDRETIYDTLRAGASGYIPKSASRARIAGILETVFEGGIHFPEDVLDTLHSREEPAQTRESIIAALTPRQLEVLALVCKGQSNKEIAAALAFIKSTWPERERGFQAEVTANDEGGS